MAVNSVLAPYPTFFDGNGAPLENGFIYIGQAGFEARTTPKASFFDVALTIPTGTASGSAIRTRGGFPVNGSNALAMFYVDGDFSISICDRNGVLLYSALSNTLALNVGGSVGPVLAPDGTLGATGFGFINETNTGFVRSGAGTMQTVIGGVLVATQTSGGTDFAQPVSGAGFSSGVLAIAQPLDPDLTALAGLAGTGIAVRTAGNTWATRQVASAGGTIAITNPAGVAGDINLEADIGGSIAAVNTTSGTFADITGITGNPNRVDFLMDGVSLSGTDNLLVQGIVAGAPETTGYDSGSRESASTSTAGFIVFLGQSARANIGTLSMFRVPGTQRWISSHSVFSSGGTICSAGGGSKTFAGEITGLRILATGANTFDAGSVSVRFSK